MVNIWEKFLHRLDQASFGGLKIWEFSIKSLIRQYGLIFLWEIVFKYPGRAIRGLFKYRRFIQERKDRDELVYVSEQPEGIWWQNWKKDRENRLVAVGFCQKLQPTPENPSGCPSGRFNHDCVYLDSGNNGSKPFYSACKTCDVKRIGILALKTGANLYIMTSARDIARHILIPALRRRRYTRAIFFLCPYSAQAIIWPLFICGIESLLIKFSYGDCLNYRDFIHADKGMKEKVTGVKLEIMQHVLQKMDLFFSPLKGRNTFHKINNIYVAKCH